MAVVVPVSGAGLYFFTDPYFTRVNGDGGGGGDSSIKLICKLYVYRRECEGECTMWG